MKEDEQRVVLTQVYIRAIQTVSIQTHMGAKSLPLKGLTLKVCATEWSGVKREKERERERERERDKK